MKSSLRLLSVPGAALLLCLATPPAIADTLVLDGDHVSDWASVFASYVWKHHDSCLYPNTLLRFDLADLASAARIEDARLYLFVERTQPAASVELWHVQNDNWSYGGSNPDTIWNWPAWHLIGSASFSDTGAISMDVTAHVQEELQAAGNQQLSLKLAAGQGQLYQSVRISSSLAPIQRMRPRIVVTYAPKNPATALPDLAIARQDISFSPMRPAPGSIVTVRAAVRNIGPADASNVSVAFWNGQPPAGQLIGTVIVPVVPGGGGEGVAALNWAAARGLREIYAVADPAHGITETDEGNNQDFRSFLVTDPAAYIDAVESFEYAGLFAWTSDFDVPKQFTYFGPKSFYLNRSGAAAYHGHYSTEMALDGTADDGTIWLETAVPVEPYTVADVAVDFELFRYSADIAFFPVVAVTLLDPEIEQDFTILPAGSHVGWWLHSYQKSLYTGPYDMLHIAVGLTVSWETSGTFFLDLIRTHVTCRTTGVPRPGEAGGPTSLFQNHPNPMGPLTTIAYRLEREGPVTLRIYDTAGRRIATLRQGSEKAGFHEARWDGTDDAGRALPSGVYFYRLVTAGAEESRKLLLAR